MLGGDLCVALNHNSASVTHGWCWIGSSGPWSTRTLLWNERVTKEGEEYHSHGMESAVCFVLTHTTHCLQAAPQRCARRLFGTRFVLWEKWPESSQFSGLPWLWHSLFFPFFFYFLFFIFKYNPSWKCLCSCIYAKGISMSSVHWVITIPEIICRAPQGQYAAGLVKLSLKTQRWPAGINERAQDESRCT